MSSRGYLEKEGFALPVVSGLAVHHGKEAWQQQQETAGYIASGQEAEVKAGAQSAFFSFALELQPRVVCIEGGSFPLQLARAR